MRPAIFFCFFLLLTSVLQAQGRAGTDSLKEIRIIRAATSTTRKSPSGGDVQTLAGKVVVQQANTLFYCDSCILNPDANVFEAFGNVHINDKDTVDVYANYLRYFTNQRMAYLRGAVKLTDGHGTLTTPSLEYDVANKIGTYKEGGRVVNNKSVLTSVEGVYYADVRDIYFKRTVVLNDPAYHLTTDSLLYNTETTLATFISKTFLRDSSGRTVETTAGQYDLRARNAIFTQRTTIRDGDITVIGNEIANDDAAGISQVRGNGVLIDKKQGMTLLGNEIFANKKTEAYLATKKPLMIIKQNDDSIYVAADTLFSARLSDLYKKPVDSAKAAPVRGKKLQPVGKDSTDRYFEAFRNVRVFSDSLQSVSDSLFYSFKDSTFRLFQNPVVWSTDNQITGDTIYVATKNKKPQHARVFENGLVINQMQPAVFNQVKGTRIDAFFKEGEIDSVRAKGAAESIYWVQDSDSAFTNVNQSASEIMDAYFVAGDLARVVFRSNVQGTLWPASQKTPAEMRLKNFQWLDARRPKTKYDLFE